MRFTPQAPNFASTFALVQDLRELDIANTQLDDFTDKRLEKRASGRPTSSILPEWVRPRLLLLTAEEARRIASVYDPTESSAESRLFIAMQE